MSRGRRQVREGDVCHRPWVSEHPFLSFFIGANVLGNLVVIVRGYNR